jgi:hypothetical protein
LTRALGDLPHEQPAGIGRVINIPASYGEI